MSPDAFQSPPPKPISEIWRPELTRLPSLTVWRRLFRRFLRRLCRCVLWICTKATVRGLENYLIKEPALVVMNHLGDPDPIPILACLPEMPEAIAKIELRSIPVLGLIMEALGVIWVHRGQADRRAVRAALEGLHQGRRIIIAPEGRESLVGALEQGTDGAAFLALKSNVPLVPITLTGTETKRILGNLKRLRRTPITLTVGKPFVLRGLTDNHEGVHEGTRRIMETLARQLPPEYRGFYTYVDARSNGPGLQATGED